MAVVEKAKIARRCAFATGGLGCHGRRPRARRRGRAIWRAVVGRLHRAHRVFRTRKVRGSWKACSMRKVRAALKPGGVGRPAFRSTMHALGRRTVTETTLLQDARVRIRGIHGPGQRAVLVLLYYHAHRPPCHRNLMTEPRIRRRVWFIVSTPPCTFAASAPVSPILVPPSQFDPPRDSKSIDRA